MAHQTTKKSPVYQPRSRAIDEFTKILLFTRAGGRCQFDGCNDYLLEHHLTFTAGNFAQAAHIVAFSPNGPRGRKKRPSDINDIANLMLLCPRCHKLIDNEPDKYSRRTLEAYKKQHEERIYHVTGLGPEQKTAVLTVTSQIGRQTAGVPYDHILESVSPRYPISRTGLNIDLTQLPTDNGGFVTTACHTIKEHVEKFLGPGGEVKQANHVSVFALAPIPILAYLGMVLGNKVPIDLYQRHRDRENWTWKDGGTGVKYEFHATKKRGSGPVALVLSLSGSIAPKSLPYKNTDTGSIYELTLAGSTPSPTFLRTRRDLEEFRNAYQLAIASIIKNHPGIGEIDLFPAVPAPIAVLCGRELLPKVHPALNVYDFDKGRGGFVYQITVNQ